MIRALVLVLVLPLAACGGGAAAADCSPASIRPCHPTAAGGCTVRGAAGDAPAVTSVLCSGAGAAVACMPSTSTICVDDCATTSYNCAAP